MATNILTNGTQLIGNGDAVFTVTVAGSPNVTVYSTVTSEMATTYYSTTPYMIISFDNLTLYYPDVFQPQKTFAVTDTQDGRFWKISGSYIFF